MPPKKPANTVLAEDALARCVAQERVRRGMSPAGLASRMTSAGCPMTQSAIWKIENGQPRRRITLDEAITFASVFEMSIEEMAQPPEVLRARRAADALEQIRRDFETRQDLARRWETALNAIGDEMKMDESGLVAETVNRVGVAAVEPPGRNQSFDPSLWRQLNAEQRDNVVESWLDVCVEDDQIVKVELSEWD
jgi:transcriptional regulator with XRE-family HTH domain